MRTPSARQSLVFVSAAWPKYIATCAAATIPPPLGPSSGAREVKRRVLSIRRAQEAISKTVMVSRSALRH